MNLSSVLNGGGAAFLDSIMATFYLPATVYVQASVYDQYGDLQITEPPHSCLAQVDAMTEAMRAEQGASDQDRAIFILSTSIDTEVTTDVEIVVNGGPYAGVRFQCASVGRDPVAAYWLIRGRRAA